MPQHSGNWASLVQTKKMKRGIVLWWLCLKQIAIHHYPVTETRFSNVLARLGSFFSPLYLNTKTDQVFGSLWYKKPTKMNSLVVLFWYCLHFIHYYRTASL